MAKRRRRRTASRSDDKDVPLARGTNERDIVVLFADIMGCSEISNHKTVELYNEFLKEFHEIFQKVATDHKALYKEHEVPFISATTRGDEGCLMLFVPGQPDLATDVDTAVNVGLDLKRRWLLSKDNKERIYEGQLPTDLGIGIHLGKAFINRSREDGKVRYQPEGYAINLAKRMESHSRDGRFTHVYVSEAARNELYLLRDEATYAFAPPHSIQPKGISRDIRVFEVKHHFLPTDWREIRVPSGPGRQARSRAILFQPTEDDVEFARKAYKASPTNLWLAEEYIYLTMRREGDSPDQEDTSTAYQDALDVSSRLATGDQRDAGILTITGFVHGERGEYAEEQELYDEACNLEKHYAEAHWYKAYSMSVALDDQLQEQDRSGAKVLDLTKEEKKTVRQIKKSYKRAIILNPNQPWIRFDLACEHWRWGEKDEAIEALSYAAQLNRTVLDYVKGEPYLKGIDGPKGPSRIKRLLKKKE